MEFEILIPEQYEELLTQKANEQGISVAELLANTIRNYLERNKENGKDYCFKRLQKYWYHGSY